MSHLDEGTLNALLDGELDDAETRQIQAHLGRCTTCETRLDEVKSVRHEADQLIDELETSSNISAVVPPKIAAAARMAALPPSGEAWPLLLPDPLDSVVLRQQRLRKLGWAATIMVIAGAGYIGLRARNAQEFAPTVSTEVERLRSTFRSDSAVLGPEESTTNPAAGSAAPVSPPATTMPTPSNPSGAIVNEPQDARAAGSAESLAKAENPQAAPAADSDRTTPVKPAPETLAIGGERQKAAQKTPQKAGAPSSSNELDEASARRLRAAAATADVERAQRSELEQREKTEQARVEAQKQMTAPPSPPTLQERAQVYLRIGLDEASRQLGGPMHVLESMSPMLVGLAPGRLSPGMDTTRPVVRAVYVDGENRMILLDQQRLRLEQSAAAAPPLRTVIDNVVVQLHGEPAVNVLRNLARRIR